MTDTEIAARVTEAVLEKAGPQSELISVNIALLTRAEITSVDVAEDRKTKTLLFLSAEARAGDGALIATAASVHKILA